MINSKKKAQISIEALIIVGVLVIGGVIFATVFLNQMNNQAKQASDLSGLTDSFLNDLDGWGTTGTGGSGTTPGNCNNNTICEYPPETTSNCEDCVVDSTGCNNNGFCEVSLGETADNCSDCVAPVFSNFTLNKYVPTGDSAINSKFSLKAQIVSSYPSVEIYDLKLEKYDVVLTDFAVSNKCTIKGVAPDTATGIYPGTLLMTIEDVSLKNQGKIIDEITCSEEGEYKFSAKARPKGISGFTPLPAQVNKIVTSTPTGCAVPGVCGLLDSCPNCPECCTLPEADSYALSLKITSPLQEGMYIINDNINLNSEISITPTPVNPPTYSCLWKDEMGSTLSTVCSGGSVPASDLNVGSKKIKLFVTADVGDPIARGLSGNSETTIHIINPLVDGQLYLSVPNKTYSGNLFNIKVYSTSESKVNPIRINNHFNFTNTNCKVIGNIDIVSQTTLGSQTIYYKDFPTDCSLPSYSSCPATLDPITVNTTSGSATGVFTSEFDLRFNSAVCNTGASDSGGLLKACVFSESGIAFNDFCNNLNNGLLKVTVNLAENTFSNNNGELKIYIK